MIRYRIRHATRYAYGQPVELAHHLLHLLPRDTPRQRVVAAALPCTPAADWRDESLDHFGNRVARLSVQRPHDSFAVTLEATVEVRPDPDPSPQGPAWEAVAATLARPAAADAVRASELRHPSPLVPALPALAALARRGLPAGRPVSEAALALARHIHATFAFDPEATDVATPLADVVTRHRGVCQDFSHVMIGALRAAGLAARYVSGYVRPRGADGAAILRGADMSHAWVAVWTGGGWVDLDPTNDCRVGADHVTLSWGRDFSDVSPLRGVLLGGGEHTLDVAVAVEAVDEPSA